MDSANLAAPPPPLPPTQPPVVVINQNNNSVNGFDGRAVLMEDIRNGVELKKTRNKVVHCSRSPSGGGAFIDGDDSLGGRGDDSSAVKKSVQNELKSKFDQVDNSNSSVVVLPSEINPNAPVLHDPLHIPMSTVIRVLQQKEQQETARIMNNSSPTSNQNGTLKRGVSPNQEPTGEKLMISHGKRNFSVKSTKKVQSVDNKSDNLITGNGKMSDNLKRLIQEDVQTTPTPPIPAVPPPQQPQENGVARMSSPEAEEISIGLQRILSRENHDSVTRVAIESTIKEVALPENHKISDQLKKLILEDVRPNDSLVNGNSTKPYNGISGSQTLPKPNKPPTGYINNSPQKPFIAVCPKPPQPSQKPVALKISPNSKSICKMDILKSPLSPKTCSPTGMNGNLIDNTIRLPLPPRVPSPPPENPKTFITQPSCDRLNKEFQEFNAYRSATLPSPKKLAINIDPNGPPNYEKKIVVSFAQDLAATPNRFPDVVQKKVPVENGSVKSKEQEQLQSMKFIIDPNNDEVIKVQI